MLSTSSPMNYVVVGLRMNTSQISAGLQSQWHGIYNRVASKNNNDDNRTKYNACIFFFNWEIIYSLKFSKKSNILLIIFPTRIEGIKVIFIVFAFIFYLKNICSVNEINEFCHFWVTHVKLKTDAETNTY